MAYELRDMSGSLFRVEEKKSERGPDYTGRIMIDGIEYRQSAWIKTAKSGRKFFSQSFQRADDFGKQADKSADAKETGIDLPIDMDDDIPF